MSSFFSKTTAAKIKRTVSSQFNSKKNTEKAFETLNPIDISQVVSTRCLPALTEKYGLQDVQVSVAASRCDYQKIIYKVTEQRKNWGYLRITSSNFYQPLLANDYRSIEYLRSYGVQNVPEPLLIEKINDRISYSVVSALPPDEKPNQETIDSVLRALEDIRSRTQLDIAFEQSDYFQTLQAVQSKLDPNFCSHAWRGVSSKPPRYRQSS